MTLRHPRLARSGLLAGVAIAPLLALALAIGTLVSPRPAGAHEIPINVTVQIFVRPDGETLHVLIRVPLNSMRDFNFPMRGPGYLNISEADPYLTEAARLWIVEYLALYEDGEQLLPPEIVRTRISIPSDPSFRSYEEAFAHVRSAPPLPEATELYWEQAMLDVALEYSIRSEDSRFALYSELAHLGLNTNTILRFRLPGTEERLFQFSGMPGVVELDPSWLQAAFRFVQLGFFHILDGIDHLLFIFCLVIPFRRILPLIAIVTSFTIAHSITLAASALGYAPNALWFPPLVEVLIALSIVYMAFENIMGVNLRRRWLVAFGFGLVHGFGFSFLLRESLQFAGGHLLTSLFAFNVGVELGQIAVLVVTVPLLVLLFRHVVAERMGIILLSALIAHTSWHWMAERWGEFRAYPLNWPVLDAAFLATSLRWMMAILILVGLVWLMFGIFGRIERLTGDGVAAAETKKA